MLYSLRHALRLMRKSPGFTAAAVLTLALGIGANTAMFSVVYALVLRPLPLDHPERLVFLNGTDPQRAGSGIPFSVTAYETLRDGASTLTGTTAFTSEALTLTGAGDPVQLSGERVSPDFFDVVGVQPVAGRAFQPQEGNPGAATVALLSEGVWERRFGRDPAILGRSITLAQTPYTVIGIVPRGFTIPRYDVDVWITQLAQYGGLSQDQIRSGAGFLNGIARLKPGVTVEQADADVGVVNRRYRVEHSAAPDADPKGRIFAAPLQDSLISDVRPTIMVLAGAVGLVLLIACANVAGLMMARAAGRTKEIAVRAALGAGRGRIVGQLLSESLLLSAFGAVLGATLSVWGVRLLSGADLGLPGLRPIEVDAGVLAFCAAVAIITGVAFGLLPALQASRPDLNAVLRDAGRGSAASRRPRARRVLVAGQMALSVVLLIAASLLIESFQRLEQVQPGFDPHHAMTMRIALPPARYPDDARRTQFLRETLGRVEALPGVNAASGSLGIPMDSWVRTPFLPEGEALVPIPRRPLAEWMAITPGYFQALGIPMVRGRAFTWADDAGAPRRVIVSQALARRYFGDADPLGKHIVYARREVPAEIVGVAGDVKSRGLDGDAGLVLYTPYPQFGWANVALAFRAAGDPRLLVNAVEAQVRAVDRDLPLIRVQTLDDYVQNALSGRRRLMWLVAGFAGLALLLAAIGLYGVMSYSVAERSAEIGIRQAIGAQPSDILRMVLSDSIRISVVGTAAGVVAAIAATRLLSRMLYHVSPTDPATFAAIAAVILTAGVAASWIPAHRATRVDPVDALRR
jgi:putative ABC transport system permease protein